MMYLKKILLLFVMMISALAARADEGMWMLHLLKQQKLSEMKAMGLQPETRYQRVDEMLIDIQQSGTE